MPTQSTPRSLALALLLTACTVREVPGDSTTGTTSDPSTSTGTTSSIPTSTTSTTTASTPTTGTLEPTTTTAPTLPGFAIDPDLPGSEQCDGLKQLDPECPRGQKCTIDDAPSVTQCVDIVDHPKGLYEPCTMMGNAWSGLDDCALGMLCWDVDERGHGVCVGLCDGTDQECKCVDPTANLIFCQECAFGLCFPWCDPLLQDCSGDDLCIPSGADFLCVVDASGDEGQTNDPCEFENSCDKGLVCLDPKVASSACVQNATGCCQPFCEFMEGQPGDCPNPDQQCLQWFDPMMPIPPGLEDVGICAIPP